MISDSEKIARLESQVKMMRLAIKTLGIDFCPACGKPHTIRDHILNDYVVLTEKGKDPDECVRVCLNDQAGVNCLVSMLQRTALLADGEAPVKYQDISGPIGTWIVLNHAYIESSHWNKIARELLTGMGFLTKDEMAIGLMIALTNRAFGVTVSTQCCNRILKKCGFELSNMEYRALLSRCIEHATQKSLAHELRIFNDLAAATFERKWR